MKRSVENQLWKKISEEDVERITLAMVEKAKKMSEEHNNGKVCYPFVTGVLQEEIRNLLKTSKIFIHTLENYPPKS